MQADIRTQLDALENTPEFTHYPLPPSERPRTSKTPCGSIAPTLLKTAYTEQREKEFERSLEYVQVQRRILKSLKEHDIALTARKAYRWTCDIVSTGQQPQPLQALRLCYYMRSLGYDTFANVKTSCDFEGKARTTTLRLLVANPESDKRGMAHDHLYWLQNVSTNETISRPYKLQLQNMQNGTDGGNALTVDLEPSFNADMIN